jgi:AraC-like DNA-binding protein
MKIAFQKQHGHPASGIVFTWMMTVNTTSLVTDHFIPEVFYDYFFVKSGAIRCIDETQKSEFVLPAQALKTLFARPLTFLFETPLVLFGARLSLGFAESFWDEMKANSFLEQAWVRDDAGDLEAFTAQVIDTVQKRCSRKWPYPMFSTALEESGWLVHFSPRHKRRLYKNTFGMSRKELQNIRNVQTFLEQTCDFASQNPRIIQHVNAEVFYDQPHLNHAFKKMTGLSPLEYFETNSILQDNLMAASYNENPDDKDKI